MCFFEVTLQEMTVIVLVVASNRWKVQIAPYCFNDIIYIFVIY